MLVQVELSILLDQGHILCGQTVLQGAQQHFGHAFFGARCRGR